MGLPASSRQPALPHRRGLSLAAAVAGALTALLSFASSQADELLVERKFRITAQELTYNLEQRSAHAQGDAVLTYEAEGVELRADTIDADLETGAVSAAGHVSVAQGQNRLSAAAVEYNLNDRTGSLQGGRGEAQGVYFTAPSLRVTPTEMVLFDGSFTTCDLIHPDYQVTAKQIIVRPGDRIIARKATLWFHGHRVVRLPDWGYSLRKGGPQSPLVPLAGFSRLDGAFGGGRYNLAAASAASAVLDARYTTRRGIRAYAAGELRPSWGQVTATVARRQDLAQADLGLFAPPAPVTDITLDRLPELAVASRPVPLGWGAATARLAVGRYHELPGDARASRAASDLYLEGGPFPVGAHVSLRPLAGARAVWYDTGQSRVAFAYGLSADSRPGKNLSLRIGYFQRTGSGGGPFRFDAIQISRELDLGLAARLGPNWRTELLVRHDLDTGDSPVLDVSVIRIRHCLEYGLTWRKVGGEFGVRLGLAQTGPVEAPSW